MHPTSVYHMLAHKRRVAGGVMYRNPLARISAFLARHFGRI